MWLIDNQYEWQIVPGFGAGIYSLVSQLIISCSLSCRVSGWSTRSNTTTLYGFVGTCLLQGLSSRFRGTEAIVTALKP